jgi:signal transduction histidine kinase
VGQPISRLMPPDKPDELPGILARLRRGQRVDHYETVRVRKDGKYLDVSVSVSPIRDGRGTIVAASAIARDITERKRQEQALREERETLETLNQLGRVIAAELDLPRLVQAVSDAATDLAGAQFGAFLCNGVDDRGDAYELCATAGALREALAQSSMPGKPDLLGSTFRGAAVVRLDDLRQDARYDRDAPFCGMLPGHLPLASYLAVPVVSRSGEVLGGLFFGHPEPGVFTERAERLVVGLAAMAAVAMDNARLYGQVQEAVRTRDEFLAAAAHDLKTPLTSIKGISQLLRRRVARGGVAATDRLLDSLAGIDATATKMAAQIDELLDLTRLQMGQPLELRRQPTDLVELVRRSVAEQQQSTERHRIHLATSQAELRGRWDAARLARVAENLLSNAIKYSPDAGDVVVTVTREQQAGTAWAVLAVRDQGLGIPAADLPRIFERFHRAGNVVGRIAGTGIGLASVRQIVEHHGGTIAVESQEGRGSTFTVRLPLEPPPR